MTNPTFKTREEWLKAAEMLIVPMIETHTSTDYPASTRVACGFPKAGRSAIGQCWDSGASADANFEMFISPVLADAPTVLSTLVHEMIHAAVGIKAGHGGMFAKVARKVGLVGKMTATTAGDELAAKLATIADQLGEYPHGVLSAASNRAKSKTYLVKCECLALDCGFTVRTTAKWIKSVGAPHCPAHGAMHCEMPEEEDADGED